MKWHSHCSNQNHLEWYGGTVLMICSAFTKCKETDKDSTFIYKLKGIDDNNIIMTE